MALRKYATRITVLGIIIAISGIILVPSDINILYFAMVVFGSYWSGLGMGLRYNGE